MRDMMEGELKKGRTRTKMLDDLKEARKRTAQERSQWNKNH